MQRHAFIIRLVRLDGGEVSGRLTEPVTGWSVGFASLAELVRLLITWSPPTHTRVIADRQAPEDT